jgi:hypothetical protein
LDQIEQLGGLDETNVSSKMLQFNQWVICPSIGYRAIYTHFRVTRYLYAF